MIDLLQVSWPATQLAEAIDLLAQRRGMKRAGIAASPHSAPTLSDDDGLGEWIVGLARSRGLEAESTESSYADAENMLRHCGPALIPLATDSERLHLALLGSSRSNALLLSRDGIVHSYPIEKLVHVICQHIEHPVSSDVDGMLSRAGVKGRQVERARRALLRERLSGQRLSGIWMVRPAPNATFRQHLRETFVKRDVVLLSISHLLQYVLWLAAWWVIGEGALGGRIDSGWLAAWGLILLSIVPLRMLETWLQGRISIGAGGLLKQRLLNGALNLDPEETRHLGSGQLLGRVIESEAIEGMALGGGFMGLVSLIEIALAVVVMTAGGSGAAASLLLLWTLVAIVVGRRYYRRRLEWTEQRLEITHSLVERMMGHRTRVAQESPDTWHREEDGEIEEYLERSKRVDGTAAILEGLIPRGWILVGLIAIVPAFVAQTEPGPLAVSIGGLLLAYMALGKLTGGISNLAGAAIAWKQMSFLFNAASRGSDPSQSAELVASRMMRLRNGHERPTRLLEASDIVFRYRDVGEPVLQGCGVAIDRGDRVLLEGPSGGGKSTLASLLVGLRQPASGLLLLDGFDRKSLGLDAWRRRIVAAPQFHENHVLMGTFAFNLLMGRRWPPTEEDINEAETICRELGLGELLERMPAGLMQNVGETGWQLSHGERSRLFIARALLQKAELIVLDESFGALDPATLRNALDCVFRRSPALLVIAHP